MLLPLGPNPHIAGFIDFNVNDVRMAADRAVLDIFLLRAGRKINRYDNLFATRITNVGAFFFHGPPLEMVLRLHWVAPEAARRTAANSQKHV